MPLLARLFGGNSFSVGTAKIPALPALIIGLVICLTSTESLAGRKRPASLPICFEGLSLDSGNVKKEECSERAGSCPPDVEDINPAQLSPASQQKLKKVISELVELYQAGSAPDRSSFSRELSSVRSSLQGMDRDTIETRSVLHQPKKLWRWQPLANGQYAIPFSMAISTRGKTWEPHSEHVDSIIAPLVGLISNDGILILDNKTTNFPITAEVRIFCQVNDKGGAALIYKSDRPEQFGEVVDVDVWSKGIGLVNGQAVRDLIKEYLPSLVWALGKHNAEGVLSVASSQAHSIGCRKSMGLMQGDSSEVLKIDCYFENEGLTVVLRSHFDRKLVGRKFSAADATSALQLTYRFISGNNGLTTLRCVYFHFMTDYRSTGFRFGKGRTSSGWLPLPRRSSSEPVRNLHKARSTSALDQLGVSAKGGYPSHSQSVLRPQLLRQVSQPAVAIIDSEAAFIARKGTARFVPFNKEYVATNSEYLVCREESECLQAVQEKNYEQLIQMAVQSRECLEARRKRFQDWYLKTAAKPAKLVSSLKPTSETFVQDLYKAMRTAEVAFQEAAETCPRVVFHSGTLTFSEYVELQRLLSEYDELRGRAESHYLDAKGLLEKVISQQSLLEENLDTLVQIIAKVVAGEQTFRGSASPLGKKARDLEKRLQDGVLFIPHDYQRHLFLYYQSLIGQVLNLLAVKGQVSMENISTILQFYEKYLDSGNHHRIVRKIRSNLKLPDNACDRTFQELREELLHCQQQGDILESLRWFTACMSGAHTDLTD